jgi:hypothetical protein
MTCAVLAACSSFSNLALADFQCDAESLYGPMSSTSSPDRNVQCKLVGRVFCMVQQRRSENMKREVAINEVAYSMSHLGETGSHVATDYRSVVTMAADYVYSHDKMLPWSRYYYAAYSCGFNQRVTEPATHAKLSPLWEKRADECQRAHPGAGNGYTNDPLRNCLGQAMDSLAAEGSAKSAKK